VRSCGSRRDEKSKSNPALAPKPSSFQLDLDDLEWFLAGIFRQVSEGIHVLHRASLRLDVLTLSIRVGEFGVGVHVLGVSPPASSGLTTPILFVVPRDVVR
jgi:hypothetical protein